MPANFSAISENEMTYVNGGASLADILAPSLEVKNWQKFNQNMVTIIGNSFMDKYIGNTVGTLFSGVYKPGNLGNAWFTGVKGAYGTGFDAGFGKHEGELTAGDKFLNGANGVLNAACVWSVLLLPSTTWQPPASRTVCPASLTSRRRRPSSLNKTV